MLARKALAGTAAAPKVYVEDVFSTYLYTGTGSSQTITNNIDLSTEGGLVWIKGRSGATGHRFTDTARGATKSLESNSTVAEATESTGLTAFGTTGFTIGADGDYNTNTATYASWTFRKAEKFFDVVTYTGNGTAGRTISHNLGSTPGCIIVKRTDTTEDWGVYHTSIGNTKALFLNGTSAQDTNVLYWNNTSPTSTQFTVGSWGGVNANGGTYVAYLFAHDAGGFGDAGDQSVIKCGSYTGNGSATGPTITLDWEPQWVLVKRASGGTESWYLMDTMRGFTTDGNVTRLYPNDSLAEDASLVGPVIAPTATGFRILTSDASFNTNGNTYVYIAIRRGPMKTPTVGTSVFDMLMDSGTAAQRTVTLTNTPDLIISRARSGSNATIYGRQNWLDRLRGKNRFLESVNTDAENSSYTDINDFAANKGTIIGADQNWAAINYSSGYPYARYFFQRAPGFFDVVCYTGTGSAGATTSHNLGVSPELIITKVRNFTGEDWIVHYRDGSTITAGYLNTTAAFAASGSAPSTDLNSFSSTSYTRNTGNRRVNSGSYNYVAYLFASCLGVSKIGAVTVASSAINVDCGFTSSARFVLLKRTSGASGWIVFDSARGIVAGDDPYLYLNSSAAENSDGASDIIDTYSSGFTLPAGGLSGITGEGTYLYLAIA